jgi:hypothetical protein
MEANNTPGSKLSSSLCEGASRELHQLEDLENLSASGGRERCQERSRLPFYYYASILAHVLLTSSYRIATPLVPRHIIRLHTIPTQRQSRNGDYQSLRYQPGLVLPIQYLQSQLRLARHIPLSKISLAARQTTASMPHNGIFLHVLHKALVLFIRQ